MAKSSTLFVCQNCEAAFPKWQGQCDNCGEWNSLVETITKPSKSGASREKMEINAKKMVEFSQVDLSQSSKKRLSTQIEEMDRVLGGGMVAGAVMLIGGEPGIGKSTLLTQLVIRLLLDETLQNGKKNKLGKILYVCGEESPHQISLRIKRILENEHSAKKSGSDKDRVKIIGKQLVFITATNVDEICLMIEKERPSLLIVDSIQTIHTDELTGAAGSAGQLRESTDRVTSVVKRLGIPTFLVGHVTKDGIIAGPKVLEHIVDTVLELSGERTDNLRILRTLKNRFGPTDEVGVFRHNDYGLEEVTNPSDIFLEHSDRSVPGSATVCVMEGSRPLLLEMQALVVKSQLAMPRRVGRGIELSRIQVLAAVLQKHCKLPLGTTDIFLSAAGGFKVKEPSIDLGLAVAIASSLKNKPLPPKTVFIGELGLLGEIRSVSHLKRRIKEAKRLGYTKVISRESHASIKQVLQEFSL